METNYTKSASEWGEAATIFQLNDCTIGNELRILLLTGVVDEDRYINYDKNWSEKLACLDSGHTSAYNLRMDQIEESLGSISQHLNIKNREKTPVSSGKIAECFKIFKSDEILKCNNEVEEFIKSVDKLMYEVARPNFKKDSSWPKQTTYAELFNRA